MKSYPVLHRAFCVLIVTKTTFAWMTTGLSSKGNERKLNHADPRPPSESSVSSPIFSTLINDDGTESAAAAFSNRRKILRTTAMASAIPFLVGATAVPTPSCAAAPLDAGEAIRRGAANIPGYGSSDVFYPESFGGSWKVTRDVQFPSAASASSDAPPPTLRLTYPMRFIRSIEDDAVVADRGYNQAELEAALARRGSGASPESTASSPPAVLSYDWAPNNPNVVRVALADGTRKEIKVTKRATERTSDTVSSSEFQRITQEDTRLLAAGGPGAVPQISARRVVSKWKRVDESTLEGIEIVYAVGAGGDPLSTSLPGQQQPGGGGAPTILSKSRLYLVR